MGTRSKNKELTLLDVSTSVEKVVTSLDSLHKKIDVISSTLDQNVKDVKTLSSSLNTLEQHSRSHSIKIFNLPLDENIGKQSTSLAKHLYTSVFKPILTLAVGENFLDDVPPVFELVDTAHLLPSAKGKPPPIHVRLRSKIYKEAIMRNKKAHFAKLDDPKSAPLLLDDITKMNADLMKATRSRDDVLSCWFFAGRVRYKTKENPDKILVANF